MVPQDQPGPVLLVPGYGGSVRELNRLATALRSEGKDVTVVRLPDDGLGDLRVQARTLAAAATAARARTGAASVDVVGYSAGGVVARLLGAGPRRRARRPAGWSRSASPHHGTEIAELGTLFAGAVPGRLPAAAALQPACWAPWTRTEAGSGPRVVSIWTTQDDVVLPPDSARLAGALNLTVQSVCPPRGCATRGLPTDPLVQGMVPAPSSAFGARRSSSGSADCRRLSS